jgi:hypothetical protein
VYAHRAATAALVGERVTLPAPSSTPMPPKPAPSVVLSWLELVQPADGAHLSELDGKWREQAFRMLDHAVTVAEALPATLTPDERQGVVRRLDFLAQAVRHGIDGGRGDEPELVANVTGEIVPRPVHSIVNNSYRDLLAACASVTNADSDRCNSEAGHHELESVARRFHDDLPARFAKAYELGLLATMLGAARHELLDVVWVGWRCLTDGEELRDVFSPSMRALDTLERARAVDRKERHWTHDRVTLRWLVPAKRPVLVSSFLGRMILSQYDLEDGEAG